jgi:hypothetical protein
MAIIESTYALNWLGGSLIPDYENVKKEKDGVR